MIGASKNQNAGGATEAVFGCSSDEVMRCYLENKEKCLGFEGLVMVENGGDDDDHMCFGEEGELAT